MLNLFLLVVGCLMDIFSALIVVVPLIVPIAQGYGVDMLHLGIIFLVNLEIGYSTPPVGLNLFIASFRFKKRITELYRASLPFLVILLIALLILTYVPGLTLLIPRLRG
jgi:TRAP-type C4-dicarboxylate transport system permease large subunit